MKKSLFIIGLMSLSLAATMHAQEENLKRVEFGLRFMPTVSSFDMQTSSGGTISGQGTLGYGGGVMLGVNLSSYIGIQGEVLYNSYSQKYKDQDLEREINVRYINIPLLVSFNTGKANPVNLTAVVGPQFGMNIGSSVNTSGSGSSDTLQTVLAIKKSDFGFAYGAGLGFILNKSHTVRLDLGFRGVYGFVNISNTSDNTTTGSHYILDRAVVKTYSGYIGFTFLF
jgi:opacity protein-like surface antigen